jgi:predicted transcriptional regulator
MPPAKISDRQVEVLLLIHRNPGATARELAATLGRSKPQGCIQSISSLVRKGWVSCDVGTCKITSEGGLVLAEAQMHLAREAAEYVRAIRRG